MKSLSKTTVLLCIAIALMVVMGGAYAFFFVAMRDKTAASAGLAVSSGEISGKESRVALALRVLKSEGPKIDKLTSSFIRESEIVVFAKKIEALGPQSGTTLTIESLEPGLTEKTIPFLGFRIKATGKFSDVMRLLSLLENYPGKFEWKTVRLVRSDGGAPQAGVVVPTSSSNPDWGVEVFLTAFNFVKE